MVAVNGPSPNIIPNLVSQEAIKPLSPEKKQEIVAEVKKLIADNQLSAGDVKQLKEYLSKQLFGSDAKLESLQPKQLQDLDAVLADALDGNLDGSNNVSEIQKIATVDVKQHESSEFAPVLFQVPTNPADANAPVKIQFNTIKEEAIPVTGGNATALDAAPVQEAVTPPTLNDGSTTVPEVVSPPSSTPVDAKRVSDLRASLENPTPATIQSLRTELKSNPALAKALLESVNDSNLTSKASVNILALALDQPGDANNNLIYDKLKGLKDPGKSIEFYGQVNAAAKSMGLNTAARKEKPEDDWGVMRKMAEIHFSSGSNNAGRPEILSPEARFQILMKIPKGESATELLRPLIRSMDNDPENKAAIKTEAEKVISQFQADVASGKLNVQVVNVTGSVTGGAGGVVGPNGQIQESDDVKRAKEILAIMNEPGDAVAPVKPVTQPDPKPVVVSKPDPEPVVAAKPNPKPVVTAKPDPEPAVVATPDPKPTVVETPQPKPHWLDDADARAKLETLSKEQQEIFQRLYDRFKDMQPQLKDLLKNGTLQKTDSKGQNVLSNLDRLLKGPHQAGVRPDQLFKDAINTLHNRNNIVQGPHGTDGAASFEYTLAKDDPAEMLRIVTDLAISGQSTLRDGYNMQAGTGSFGFHKGDLTADNKPESRSDFDVIFQSAAMRSISQTGGDIGKPMIDMADYNVKSDTGGTWANMKGDTGSSPELLAKLATAVTGKPHKATDVNTINVPLVDDANAQEAYAQIESALKAGKQPLAVVNLNGMFSMYYQYVAVEKIEGGKVYFKDTNNGGGSQSRTLSLSVEDFKKKLEYMMSPQ